MKPCPEQSSGDALLLAATATSIALAKGRTEDELAVLAAFFTVLGDSLALLATTSPGA
jgi:hypothetical protein